VTRSLESHFQLQIIKSDVVKSDVVKLVAPETWLKQMGYPNIGTRAWQWKLTARNFISERKIMKKVEFHDLFA